MPISDKLRNLKRPHQPKPPVWEGPSGTGPNGGITFSLLSRWLTCRERFRVLVVEGLRPAEEFNHYIEYGNMWHVCEEAFAHHVSTEAPATKEDWKPFLEDYTRKLAARPENAMHREAILKWHNCCLQQFPVYVDYWSKHTEKRTPLKAEQTFDTPYSLPSGREVRLRGKWDSVDLMTVEGKKGIWLQENKTKSEIDEVSLMRHLKFDLQTMLYMVTLRTELDLGSASVFGPEVWAHASPLVGVRYNVIKRPLSGGVGSIRQHKPTKSNPAGESLKDYYDRLGGIIRENPATFFCRFATPIFPEDVKKFQDTCLDPMLEELCQWWETATGTQEIGLGGLFPKYPHKTQNWRHPFGVRNILDEGGSTDLDNYLDTGSTVGLVRVETMFRELQP